MVVAYLLNEQFPGVEVKIYFHERPRPETGFPEKLTWTEAENQIGQLIADEHVWLDFTTDLHEASLVVDGLLGAGLSREVTGVLADIIKQVNGERESRSLTDDPLFVISIDVPSGLNGDTGQPMGIAIKADVTVTLGQPKIGLFQYKAVDYTGDIKIGDIGLPQQLLDELYAMPLPFLISAGLVKRWLPSRPRLGHKGTFGRLMVVSGSDEYPGAPYLCTVASMRAGAGLVTLAASGRVIDIMASRSSENTYFELKLPGTEEESVLPQFEQKLEDYRVLLLGPGLGEFSWKPSYVLGLDVVKKLRLVIDADGLNYLTHTPDWWNSITPNNILTPHPAELARLTGQTVFEIEADRLNAALVAARKFSQIVVLKGAYTIVAAPDGKYAVSPAANPALATAGSGDVLAGICAGLLVQATRFDDCDPFKIACCGVYVHAMAGELARRELGDTGTLAGDLLAYVPRAINGIKQGDSIE
jgi:NAD(P)H-hydrate epimerase